MATRSSALRSQFSKTAYELDLLANELRELRGATATKQSAEAIATFQRTHDGVRVFLVSEKGVVLAPTKAVQDRSAIAVSMTTIRNAVAQPGSTPVFGEDPQRMNQRVRIAVVPVTIDSSLRYLYAVSDPSSQSGFGLFSYEATPATLCLILILCIFTLLLGTFLYLILLRLRQVSLAVAGISHDVRGPLTSIQARLEELHEVVPATHRPKATLAFKDTKVLGRMINDLHELSLLEARGSEVIKEPFSISELLSDIVASLSARAQERSISILAEIPQNLPHVLGSISLLDRMIRNLLENSCRYTPDGGKIFIHASKLEGKVRIIVSDTGVGIDNKDLDHAGKKFWRGPLTAAKTEGTGLGLFIARRIAALHGSALRIVSTKGDGTAVYFDVMSLMKK